MLEAAKKTPRTFKGLLDFLAKSLGYEIRRPKNAFDDQRNLLSAFAVRTIFDVGANIGDVTAEYRRRFPSATIYSFEPLAKELGELCKRFERDSLVKPVPLAASSKTYKAKFYINRERAASSLLPTLDESVYSDVNPDLARHIATLTVPTTTLDDFCSQESISEVAVLKVDVQGGELGVLEGATKILSCGSVLLVYLEVSFIPMYTGQALYYELCSFLFDYGYVLFDWYDLGYSTSRRVTHGDALFINSRISC